MKNNKNMLFQSLAIVTLLAVSPVANSTAMEKNSKDQQGYSWSGKLKNCANACLGLFFYGFATNRYDKQLHAERYSTDYGVQRFAKAKGYRNIAIGSGLLSGYFFYNALSGFTGKKLSVNIVNNNK